MSGGRSSLHWWVLGYSGISLHVSLLCYHIWAVQMSSYPVANIEVSRTSDLTYQSGRLGYTVQLESVYILWLV